MDTEFILASALLFTLTFVTGQVFLAVTRRRRAQRWQIEDAKRDAEHAERKLKQKRDHQLNHGRMIYNWLVKELAEYKDVGFFLWKMEDNGGSFTICVERESGGYRTPILQLDYDFLKYAEPYQGHIHYGAYGADILFWVGGHAPHACLHELVLAKAEEYAKRLRTPQTT